jgi:hypothetical protein
MSSSLEDVSFLEMCSIFLISKIKITKLLKYLFSLLKKTILVLTPLLIDCVLLSMALPLTTINEDNSVFINKEDELLKKEEYNKYKYLYDKIKDGMRRVNKPLSEISTRPLTYNEDRIKQEL